MITTADLILAMHEASSTNQEIAAHLRKLNPSAHPTYWPRYIQRVLCKAKREAKAEAK